jgi:translation elongation factor EF-4
VDGELRKGDIVRFMNTGCEYDITELGVLAPKPVEVRSLSSCLLSFALLA